MIPTLVKIRDEVVDCIFICKDSEHLEKMFTEQAKMEGIEVTDDDKDNGYVETEVGSICMSWATKAQ